MLCVDRVSSDSLFILGNLSKNGVLLQYEYPLAPSMYDNLTCSEYKWGSVTLIRAFVYCAQQHKETYCVQCVWPVPYIAGRQ